MKALLRFMALRWILADKPVFADVAEEFLAFISSDPLVIHNASFDMAFINAELTRIDRPVLSIDRSIDALAIARKSFQAHRQSGCVMSTVRYDNTHRTLHGALLDADLLARVYIELLGGRQPGLSLDDDQDSKSKTPRDEVDNPNFQIDANNIRPVRLHAPTEDE